MPSLADKLIDRAHLPRRRRCYRLNTPYIGKGVGRGFPPRPTVDVHPGHLSGIRWRSETGCFSPYRAPRRG